MSKIRSSNTKLERLFKEKLIEAKIPQLEYNPKSYRLHPDIIHSSKKIAIFLDSCFWHGCKLHLRLPKTKQEYWIDKIKRNKKRDALANRTLKADGWIVYRIWEHSIKKPKNFRRWITYIKNKIII